MGVVDLILMALLFGGLIAVVAWATTRRRQQSASQDVKKTDGSSEGE